VLLEEILKAAVGRAEKTIMEKNPSLLNRKEVARQVGIGAVIFNDLKQDRIKNINFEWDKVLNFEGDSCPYLQYAYVRANSIIEKAGKGGKQGILLRENEEIMLAKKLADFPFIVESAANQNKPNIIAQYLLELAASFSNFYSNCKVIGSEHEKQRLSLVKASGMVIEIGLNLLNIETPEKM
jgi:arginyl-tRNA synthetase